MLPVKEGEYPITLVHAVPEVPESYRRLYEVIGEPSFIVSDTRLEADAQVA
jgi:hypothetical protein